MIDIKDLRINPKAYKDSAQQRGISVNIDKILELDAKRLKLVAGVDGLRGELNLDGKPTPEQLKKLQETKAKLAKLESELQEADIKLSEGLMQVPNLVAEGTPEGGEEANEPVRHWGENKRPDFPVKDHLTIGVENDWLDFERGAKVAGSKFYYLKGSVVRLELAVMQMAMDELAGEGFTAMAVPHMVSGRVFEGTGFLPRGEEDQTYKIGGEDLILIATAEIALTGYHADEILDPTKLPLAYAGISPSYRREAGAYGKHSKGLYRVHQFDKLEMYVFCLPEQSADWHMKILELEEKLCQMLEIPYRVVRIAAGDLGAPAYKKFDIEYWSPVDDKYRELTSCSNCTDFQSRRLNVRTRAEDGKTEFVHTLNGTAIAFSRVLIALIENHQQADGSIKLPLALHNYYGGTKL